MSNILSNKMCYSDRSTARTETLLSKAARGKMAVRDKKQKKNEGQPPH